MSTVTLPNTIASGDADNPTRDMANWTTIRDIINGNLDNTNISATAAIQKSKLEETMLGYAEATADQNTISTITDITNCSVTVTVPSGGRRVRITGCVRVLNNGGPINTHISIRESTTQLNIADITVAANTYYNMFYPTAIITPSAGSHTYKLSAAVDSSTIDIKASATAPNFILVELL